MKRIKFKVSKSKILIAAGTQVLIGATFAGSYFFISQNKKYDDNALNSDYKDVKIINNENNNLINLPKASSSVFPSSIPKPIDGVTKDGIKYTFKLWTTNDETGKIHWVAILNPNTPSKKEISGTITGFKRLYDKKLANIYRVTKNELLSTLGKVEPNVKASTINKPADGWTKHGVKYTFTKWNTNDETGVITYTAHLTMGKSILRDVNGTIRGYESTASNDSIDIDAVCEDDLSNLPHSFKTIKASTVKKPNDGLTALGVQYIFRKWDQNDENGTIEWTVHLTKGTGKEKDISGTIHGYEDKDDRDTSTIREVIKDDLWNLPSVSSNTICSLVPKPDDGVTYSGVHYTFSWWIPNDETGTITFVANLTKNNGKPRYFHGILSGYKSSDEMNIINKVTPKDLKNLPIVSSSTLPSRIQKPNDGSTTSEVHYTFTRWDANDEEGEILWSARLTKGDYGVKNISGRLSGYKIHVTHFKSYKNENDLINAIKGIANESDNNVKVGEWVKIGNNDLFKITQDYFNTEKMKNSYKGSFSSDAQRDAFLAITTKVNSNQFDEENQLKAISLPKVTEITSYAFTSSRLIDEVDIPQVRKIGEGAFGLSHIRRLYLPEVVEIGAVAFTRSALSYLYMPRIQKIGDENYDSCGPFTSILNSEDTLVVLHDSVDSKGNHFNSDKYKDYLFSERGWDQIKFKWV